MLHNPFTSEVAKLKEKVRMLEVRVKLVIPSVTVHCVAEVTCEFKKESFRARS